jgi:DNA repair exonuclease SbcCD ATPase subunit
VSSADLKCPVCNKTLEGPEHDYAAKQLEKSVLQKYRDQLKKSKQEHETKLAKFRLEQREHMQAMAKKHQNEKKSMQKSLAEQTKKSKVSQKRELAELRRNYQAQLEQMRDFYGTQNNALQAELKASFAAQLEGMKKNYEGLSAGNQRQLEIIQKYLEDQLVGELREKANQLEKDKMSAELKLSEMVQQLDQRNAEVVSLKERLNRMDAIAEEHTPAQVPSETLEPGSSNQQELLRIVKEVAEQQQELGELKELEEDSPGEEEEKHGFWGSKPGKRFGLF